jgi:4-hydroxybenzoate polyprenyltransferase
MRGPLGTALAFGRLVRFSHTVFALPFALMGMLLAAGGLPDLRTVLLILVAMVAARSAAMAMNRLADHRMDAENPRTRGRELPSGVLRRRAVWWFLGVSVVVFVAACALLNRLTLALSPVALAVLLSYPYAKRFTSLCHLWLGVALGLSPVGAWVAVRGEFGAACLPVVLLGAAVTLWTAGFDVIYAVLDVAFDRERGLFSLPARLGVAPALALSAALHVLTVLLLVLTGTTGGMGWPWFAGVGCVALLLLFEHWIVRPGDLSRVGTAFFTVNGIVSVLLMAVLFADRLL